MTETSTPDIEGPLEAAAVDPRCTLLQYVRTRRIRLSPKELSLAGQVLAARCRADGIDLSKVKERGGWRKLGRIDGFRTRTDAACFPLRRIRATEAALRPMYAIIPATISPGIGT